MECTYPPRLFRVVSLCGTPCVICVHNFKLDLRSSVIYSERVRAPYVITTWHGPKVKVQCVFGPTVGIWPGTAEYGPDVRTRMCVQSQWWTSDTGSFKRLRRKSSPDHSSENTREGVLPINERNWRWQLFRWRRLVEWSFFSRTMKSRWNLILIRLAAEVRIMTTV